MAWRLETLPGLCAAAALLELDAVHVGQWMISRPCVLGPALGWAAGSLLWGIQAGIIIELLLSGEAPLGNALPINGAIATAAAVVLSAGPMPVEPALALPVGLVVGRAHNTLERAVRSMRSKLSRRAEELVGRAGTAPIGLLMFYGLAAHGILTAGYLYSVLLVGQPLLATAWTGSPEDVRAGFRLALSVAPWLGMTRLLGAFLK